MPTLREQFTRHSVALISLTVAVGSLGYNTWRNEKTEANRNVRTAGIELLLKLGDLERVVFFSHYDRGLIEGNPRSGWAYALTIRDLGELIPNPAGASSERLVRDWQANWSRLGNSDDAAKKISASIDTTRADVLEVLAELD
jgi:hypothetical protein